MHLKKLVLKNFKTHENTVIEFGNITWLEGKNGSGKTNILRALKLLLQHGDWPATYIQHGKSSAEISIELVNGNKVVRKRTKTTQSIDITEDGVTTSYTGKKDAVTFVERALGIRKVILDKASGPEDLNFIDVYDPPFLMHGRSDTIQRKTAGVLGSNTLEEALTRLQKNQRRLSSEKTSLENLIVKLESPLKRAQTTLESGAQLFERIENLEELRQKHQSKVDKINNCIYHNNLVVPIYNIGSNVDKLRVSLNKLLETRDKLLKNSVAIKQYFTSKSSLEKLEKFQQAPLSDLKKEYSRRKRVIDLISEIKSIDLKLIAYQNQIDNAVEEKEELLKNVKLCSACGNPLPD